MRGRSNGVKNYKNEKLLDLLEAHLPTGGEQWRKVAELYKLAAEEEVVRDPLDIKHHFMKKLCNSGQKPTGTKTLTSLQQRALQIFSQMQAREAAITVGCGEGDWNLAEEEEEADEEDEREEDDDNDETVSSPQAAKRQRTSSTASVSSAITPTISPPTMQKSKNVKVYNQNSKRAGTAAIIKDLVGVIKEGNEQQQMMELLKLQQEQMKAMYERDRARERAERERERKLSRMLQEMRSLVAHGNQCVPAFDRWEGGMRGVQHRSDYGSSYDGDVIGVGDMATQDINDEESD